MARMSGRVVVVLAMLLALAGCGLFVDRPYVESLVWSGDGHIYYEVDSFDGPHDEVWRRDAAGRAAVYPIPRPAEVGNGSCDIRSGLSVDPPSDSLFTWPDGALGDFFPCQDGDRYYALDSGSGTLTLVAKLQAGTGIAAWTDRGRTGIAGGPACFGFSLVVDGAVRGRPGPVDINGGRDDLRPVGQTGPCDATGVGFLAAAPPGGLYWVFSFASHLPSRDALMGSDPEHPSDQIYVWRAGAPAPTLLADHLDDVLDLDLDDRFGLVAVTTIKVVQSQVALYSIATGRRVLTLSADEIAFSPDGTKLAYARGDGIHILDVLPK